MESLGLALGGGGARGLAHILALETIDSSGIKPTAISGTSMGAIIGALYAAGRSGAEIHQGIAEHFVRSGNPVKSIINKAPGFLKWMKAVRLEMKGTGFLKADGFLKYLHEEIGVATFEELEIPLSVVATDFWTGEEVVFSSGPLLPAIGASMAIPGVFTPIVIDGRVLVDGGIVNNVPFDILRDKCTRTVAIDVAPSRSHDEHSIPKMVDIVLGTFDMLVEKVIQFLELLKKLSKIHTLTSTLQEAQFLQLLPEF